MKRALIILILLLPFTLGAQEIQKIPITTNQLADGVYRLFVNNAVAVVAFTGNDGLLIVDAAYERSGNVLLEELQSISQEPLKYIINTHIHGDHTGGNLVLGKGVDIIAHKNVKDYLSTERTQGDRVIPAFPEYAQPNISFTDTLFLHFNEQDLQLFHMPGGHTSGDVVIYFPKSKVLVVGDLLFANYFPYVDVGNGGNPFKYLKNINWLTENFPNDVTLVGGHGPVYSMDDYITYRETLQKTMDVVKKHKQDGMTLEQMKEQRVLSEWESMGKFFITEDRWIETIYPFL